jgi:hypothetical protein
MNPEREKELLEKLVFDEKKLEPGVGGVIPFMAYAIVYSEPTLIDIQWPNGGVHYVIPVKEFYWLKDNHLIEKIQQEDKSFETWRISQHGRERLVEL